MLRFSFLSRKFVICSHRPLSLTGPLSPMGVSVGPWGPMRLGGVPAMGSPARFLVCCLEVLATGSLWCGSRCAREGFCYPVATLLRWDGSSGRSVSCSSHGSCSQSLGLDGSPVTGPACTVPPLGFECEATDCHDPIAIPLVCKVTTLLAAFVWLQGLASR